MISGRFILSQIIDLIHNETYQLLAILHKELKLRGSLHRTLQILSVHPFEKIVLHELLMKNEVENSDGANFNQMELFDLYPDTSEILHKNATQIYGCSAILKKTREPFFPVRAKRDWQKLVDQKGVF